MRFLSLAPIVMLATLAFAAGGGSSRAQSAAREIPQSIAVEHADTMERLVALSKRKGPVGVEARKATDLFRRHIAREHDYILPPLTLLPELADGKVTPDMAWALPMCDRVKADREQIFEEHTKVTDAMNALMTAGLRAHDKQAVDFAKGAVADSLNDIEIEEPAVMLVGDYLRAKLPTPR